MLTTKQVRAIMQKYGRNSKDSVFVHKVKDPNVRTIKCFYTYDANSTALLQELRNADSSVRLIEHKGCTGSICVRALVA
jgi:catabolite regulation protein CreA